MSTPRSTSARSTSALAALVVTIALLGPALAVNEASAATVKCSAVHGKVVLKSSALLVVSVKFRRVNRSGRTQLVGRRFEACARPSGRVHVVGRTYREFAFPGKRRGPALESGGVTIGKSAGTFFTAEIRQANLTGDYAETTDEVVNAATGKAYRYYHHLMSPSVPPGPSWAPPARILLNAQGQLAGVFVNPAGTAPAQYSEPAPGEWEVMGFDAAGTRFVFDRGSSSDIPADSLSLSGATVGWIDKGRPMTASIQ